MDPETGALVWRGLRIRMGMSYGKINNKKPLNTGRADYFGALANTAARTMAIAAPGQVVFHLSQVGGCGSDVCDVWRIWCCILPWRYYRGWRRCLCSIQYVP